MEDIIQTQLIKINIPQFETNVLEFICKRSNSLFNQAVYYIKRNHEMTHPGQLPNVPYEMMANDLKEEWNYSMLYSQVAQQTLKSVEEAFSSYKALMQCWWNKEVMAEPKPPKYRKKGGLFQCTYPSQALTFFLDRPVVRIPLGLAMGELEGVKELFLPCPTKIRPEQIVELTIVPRNYP